MRARRHGGIREPREACGLRAGIVAAGLAAVGLWASGAGAQGAGTGTAARPITLKWTVPDGCPDREALAGRIEALLGAPPAPAGAAGAAGAAAGAPRKLDASGTVEALPRGFRLELTVATETSESTRILQGARCDSVTDAAALVIALAFDPEAVAAQELRRAEAEQRGAAGDGGASPAPSGSPDAPPAPPAPSATDVIRIPVPLPPASSFPFVAPPPTARPAAPSRPVGIGAFVDFAGDAGTLPSVAPGVRAGLSVVLAGFHLEPAFEAWPSSQRALADRPGAGADVRLLAFDLHACRRLFPWSVAEGAAPGASALGCLGFEIGEMRGAGFGVPQPASGSVLWSAPQAELRAELPFLTWAAVRIHLGLAVPLDARRFVFDLADGVTVVHQPSPIAGRAGIGLALHL